jgi:hypothetical protein
MQYEIGHWDEALRSADAFIAECEQGAPHYIETSLLRVRARILHARDDLAAAEADAVRGLELSRAIGEPQALIPALTVAALVLDAAGRAEEARRLAPEVLDYYRQGNAAYSFSTALIFDRLGLRDELRGVFLEQPMLSAREALAILGGDYVGAAELAEAEGSATLEAQARLAAARAFAEQGRRAEADAQLAKALAFFRSVGATRYVREGEALLAATA